MFQSWDSCIDKDTQIATLKCIPIVFHNVISAALMFGGTVAVFLIVYSGIQLARSGGDPKNIQSARQIMTYAIIGLVLVLSSFAIIYLIAYVTKADCITQFGFDSCTK